MADIIDKNPQNDMPDILEDRDFEAGDILTADTMNQVIAAIRGTYQILTKAPELTYANIDGYRQGQVKEWAENESMKLIFDFSSPVYGPVTVSVNQYENGIFLKTFSGSYEQGTITINLGTATGQHRYTYEVTAKDSNGRSAMDGSDPKKLIFSQFIGGFTFNTNLDQKITNTYFVANTEIEVPEIPYEFKYVGQENASEIKKVIVAYFKGAEDTLLLNKEITANEGTYNLKFTPTLTEAQTLIIEGRVCKKADGTIVRKRAFNYPIYISSTANAITMTLEAQPEIDDLNVDSRLSIPYRVSWFKPWENLTVNVVGKLLDKQTGLEIKSKTAKFLITHNNSVINYKLITFPFSDVDKTYTVQMKFELTGANAAQAVITEPEDIDIKVAPSKSGERFVTEGLLAYFAASERTNNSEDKEKWFPVQGAHVDDWFFNIKSGSYTNPEPGQSWDQVGAGWKEELDAGGNIIANYLHLKHNAYATLSSRENPEVNINLADYFKKSNFTLETFIKTNEAVNLLGYNLACLTEDYKNGFCIKPTLAAALTGIVDDDINAQQYNASGLLDNAWTHIAFVATPENPNNDPELTGGEEIEVLENSLPALASMQLYINGVLVKMAANSVPSGDPCYLYLNNLLDRLNSDKESDTKIQFIRIYETALRASEIRKNYINSLTDAQVAAAISERNNLGQCRLPVMTLVAEPFDPAKPGSGSKNGFNVEGAHNNGYAINSFVRADKKNDPAQGHLPDFPGAGKVYVKCAMHYVDPVLEQEQHLEHVEVAVQGTSSLDYPVKNYKIVVYNDKGEKNKTYRPVTKQDSTSNWYGDSTYTLKCDYMEHSHKNNTPTAMFYNKQLLAALLADESGKEIKNLQSPARQALYNDAIDGFPILLYCQDVNETAPKYIGTYMFNTDKAGLDQGFAIPLKNATTFNIPYYEKGHKCTQVWNDDKEIFESVITGVEDEQAKIQTLTDTVMPCISYEGGSNVNISAATFLSQAERNYVHKIDPVLYEEAPNKWKYYQETLEPRYNVFDDHINSETEEDLYNSLTYNPIDRAIAWIESVWPIDTSKEVVVTPLFSQTSFAETENWEIENGSIEVHGNHVVLKRTNNSSNAIFHYKIQMPVNKKHVANYTLHCNSTTAADFTIKIQDVTNDLELTAQRVELFPNRPLEKNYRFATNQSNCLDMTIVINNGMDVTISQFDIRQSGEDILKLEFPEWSSKQRGQYVDEFKKLFSYEYCLAYYLQALAFMQADNIGKNAMFDVWWINQPPQEGDWDYNANSLLNPSGHWSKIYPRPYDMDSQMGLNNQGQDITLASAEINPIISPDPTAKDQAKPHRRFDNQYAISFSKLWLLFAHLFQADIRKTYNNLRKAITIGEGENQQVKRPAIYDIETIKNAIEPYTTDVIGECYYNADAQKKFIASDPKDSTNWRMISGNRYHRYYSFLADRLDFLDGYFADTGNEDAIRSKIAMRVKENEIATMQFASKKPSYIRYYVENGVSGITYVDTDINPTLEWYAQANNKNCYLYSVQHLNRINGIASLQVEDIMFTNADALQHLTLSPQRTLGKLVLTNQPSLRNITLDSCSSLAELSLPNDPGNLAHISYKNLNKIAPHIILENAGLIDLEVENLAQDLIGDKQLFTISLTNTPIQEIKVGPNARIREISLMNCYQLTEFTDSALNPKYGDLKTLNIQQCYKMEKITLPYCKAEAIQIANCNNLKELTLRNSTALKELDLSTLQELTYVDLSYCTNLEKLTLPKNNKITTLLVNGCTNLSTICYPADTEEAQEAALGHFDFSGCKAANENNWTNLALSGTGAQYIDNLKYHGSGLNLFQDCSQLIGFTNTELQFTSSSANNCFKNCGLLQFNKVDINFLQSDKVTSLASAFDGCHVIGLHIPYELAKACPKASNFEKYIANQLSIDDWESNMSDDDYDLFINNYQTFPEDVYTHGFFAIEETAGNFTVRAVDELKVERFAEYCATIVNDIPTNFFLNVPKIKSLKLAFAHVDDGYISKATPIELQKLLQPILNKLGATETLSLQSMFLGFGLKSIGTFDNNWVNIPISNINSIFYNNSNLGKESTSMSDEEKEASRLSIVKFIRGLTEITSANAAFARTGIVDLTANGDIETPLFVNNKKLVTANAMFAGCPNLISIPLYLCSATESTNPNSVDYALEEISAIFSKGSTNPSKRITIDTLDESFLYNTNIKTMGYYTCTSSNTFGDNKTTYSVNSGAFSAAKINNIDVTFINKLTKVTNISGLFANTIGFTTVPFGFKNCPELTTIKDLFKNSQIQEFNLPDGEMVFDPNTNSKITDATSCFENSGLLSLARLNIWKLPQLTNATSVFKNCKALRGRINELVFDTPQLTKCTSMFEGCIGLGFFTSFDEDQDMDTIVGSADNDIEAINRNIFANAPLLADTSKMFKNCYSLYGMLPQVNTENPTGLFHYNNSSIKTISEMFRNCCSLRGAIPHLFTATKKYNVLEDISYLFCGCGFLTNPFDNGSTTFSRDLVPLNWLSNCSSLYNISGLFAMVGTGFSVLSRYATDKDKENMQKDPLNLMLVAKSALNATSTATAFTELKTAPCYSILQKLAIQYSEAYSVTPLKIDFNIFSGNHMKTVRHANETFAFLGKIEPVNLKYFLTYESGSAAILSTNLVQANFCFAGTVLVQTSEKTEQQLKLTGIESLPFYNNGNTHLTLQMQGCYANLLDKAKKLQGQDTNFIISPYGLLTETEVADYFKLFRNSKASMFVYQANSQDNIENPCAHPVSANLQGKWTRYGIPIHTVPDGGYLYYCCNKLATTENLTS